MLDTGMEFHCFGGFAISLLYGLERQTADIDIVAAVVRDQIENLHEIAGKDSKLHVKYGVYLDPVGVLAPLPVDYEERLTDAAPSLFKNIRLMVLEAHDIALAKIARNSPRDIADVKHLARKAKLDTETLRKRFEAEVRPYLIGPEGREELTLNLWIEMIDEERSNK